MKKRLTVGAAVVMLTAGVTMFGVTTGHAEDFDYRQDFDGRVLKGFKISPVPLNLRRLDPALVGLGSYIVNAQGGCNDCHTAPSYADGGNPFLGQKERINTAGYLAGGTPFGPSVISRNITPDSKGLPAGLTWDQFRQALRKGTDFKKGHPAPILQVMPWPVYANMSTLELRAIYEFLRAIPGISTEPTS